MLDSLRALKNDFCSHHPSAWAYIVPFELMVIVIGTFALFGHFG